MCHLGISIVVVVSVILLWQTELEHVTERAEPSRTKLKHVTELKQVTEREHDTKLKHVTERGKPMRVRTRASLRPHSSCTLLVYEALRVRTRASLRPHSSCTLLVYEALRVRTRASLNLLMSYLFRTYSMSQQLCHFFFC
jgi:hypothetical protein